MAALVTATLWSPLVRSSAIVARFGGLFSSSRRRGLSEQVTDPNRGTVEKEGPEPGHALKDKFHRQHTYLRISLTERCNLRCELPRSWIKRVGLVVSRLS